MKLDPRQERAVIEMVASGAIEVMVSRMLLRASIEFAGNDVPMNDEQVWDFRSDMRAIRKFDQEAQAVINEKA